MLQLICDNCKRVLPPDSEFCHFCGAKISKDSVGTAPLTNTVSNQVFDDNQNIALKSLKSRNQSILIASVIVAILVFGLLLQ